MSTAKSGSGKANVAFIDQLLERKKPNVKRVPIINDPELADEAARVELRVEDLRARRRLDPNNDAVLNDFEDALAELESLTERVNADTTVFMFRSIGRDAYDELIDEHPPTPEQSKKAREAARALDPRKRVAPIGFNPATFPLAIITASLFEPEELAGDADAIKRLWHSDRYNAAECMALFNGALDANEQRRVASLGKDSITTSD